MSFIYHLAPATRWQSWPSNEPYLPAEYEKDGFIHCTAGDELMIKVANRFYRHVAGDYILVVIDTAKLDDATSPVKWESASEFDSLFPHIYGAIDKKAVIETRTVQRSDDGTFIGWSATN